MAAPTELIVADPEALAACCEHLAASAVIGLDTEFIGEETYVPDLCLIQVATPEQLILIDPLACESLDAFWQLIVDPRRVVIVHAGREEIRLCHFACDQVPGNLFDLQIAAGLLGLGYPLGYGALIQEVLGRRLAKGETLTNWRKRPLTDEQTHYAFDDVRYLLPLWQNLSAELTNLGRLGWIREETEMLKHRAVVDNPVIERWRKLRGIGALDRRKLAIVRELFAWREEKAARHNRPARVILRDDLIVEIARRNPHKEADLQSLRGLGKADFTGIVGAANRARALPPDEWPEMTERDNDPPQVGLVVTLLNAIFSDLCSRMRVTAALAATTLDMKKLVRARMHNEPPPADSHLTHGWRRENLLPELLTFLEGRRGIRIGDLRKDSPLEYLDWDEKPPGKPGAI
jgi:ribonuclease D